MAVTILGGRGFSIRTKIFFGCISLTFVTKIVGVLLQETQSELSRTAPPLLETSGDAEMVVRLGSDEFAIIQQSAHGSAMAAILAQRVIVALAAPFFIDGHHISAGASLGIVETADPADTPDALLKHADLALYLAKTEGRGTYRFFERSLDAHVQTKRSSSSTCAGPSPSGHSMSTINRFSTRGRAR